MCESCVKTCAECHVRFYQRFGEGIERALRICTEVACCDFRCVVQIRTVLSQFIEVLYQRCHSYFQRVMCRTNYAIFVLAIGKFCKFVIGSENSFSSRTVCPCFATSISKVVSMYACGDAVVLLVCIRLRRSRVVVYSLLALV